MKKLSLILIIFVCIARTMFAQSFSEPELDQIDSLIVRVKNSLSHDWFVVKQRDGFDVYFCRSCNENFLDSINEKPAYDRISIQKGTIPKFFSRELMFEQNGPDSVCYYSTVSQAYTTDANEIRKLYKANGIMKISVRLEPKWSAMKCGLVESNNNTLKNEIIKEPLGKTNMTIFEDYRYWIPNQTWLLNRIKNFDFSFQQMPYSSDWFDNSIFIYQDKPSQFCNAMYCNPKDKNYYKDQRNNLEHERTDALTSIAYALGIKDYKILN